MRQQYLAVGAFVTTGVAMMLIVVGLATPNWQSISGGNSGLFKYCKSTTCSDINRFYASKNERVPNALTVARALVILGFVCAFLAVVLCAVLIVSGTTEALKYGADYLPAALSISAVVGGVLTIAGCIIYICRPTMYEEVVLAYDPIFNTTGPVSLEYSSILCLTGGIILIVSSFIESKDGIPALFVCLVMCRCLRCFLG